MICVSQFCAHTQNTLNLFQPHPNLMMFAQQVQPKYEKTSVCFMRRDHVQTYCKIW